MNENQATIWQTHMRQWEQSGRSQKRYCEERGLALSTFRWWRGRLRDSVSSERAAMVRVPAAVGGASERGELVVEVGRFRVGIRGTVDGRQLGSVLDILENR